MVLFIMEHAVDFFRRIMIPCRTFSRLVVWLIYKPHNERCEQRRQCAQDLLELFRDGRLADVTTQTFGVVFQEQLADIAYNGKMQHRLWVFVRDWVLLCDADTQDIEATNSILRHFVVLSPGTALYCCFLFVRSC